MLSYSDANKMWQKEKKSTEEILCYGYICDV